MRHADWLIKRVLFLEGLPNLQELDKLQIGESVKEILECDLRLEHKGIPDLKAAILHAESVQDYISRDLFRKILDAEEEHVDYMETQLDLLGRIGPEHFTQLQSEANETGADD